MNEPNICTECKHCISDSRYPTFNKCRKVYRNINFVTGERTYEYCRNFNSFGDCKDYEPTITKRIKQWMGVL